VNGYGNNLYLDDINLSTTLGSVAANFTASATSLCQNGTISFTDLSLGTPTAWLWNFGDGNTSTLQNPSHQYITPGQKTVSLTASHPGSSNTHVKNEYILVNVLPEVFLGNDTIIPQTDSLMLDAGAGFWAYQWNTGETSSIKKVTSTGVYSVTVASAPGCSDTDSIYVKKGYSDVYGKVSYFNSVNSPLDSVLVYLKSGTTVVQTNMVDPDGDFHFTNVSPGTYSLEAFSGKGWGGANATDAMLVLKHFVNISSLSGLKLKSANVDNSVMVNSLDAMLISRRFTGSLSSFPSGNWAFEKPVFVFNGNGDITQNIKALCYGDVNGSYIPFARTSAVPQLEVKGKSGLDVSGSTIVPLTADRDLVLGAISLIIDFPSAVYDITGVNGPQGDNAQLDYHKSDGRISIAWYRAEPLFIKAGEPLLELQLKAGGTSTGPLLLQSVNGSELADGDALIYPAVTLLYPEIENLEGDKGLQINVFPNPGSDVFLITLKGAEKEPVILEVSNALGEMVSRESLTISAIEAGHKINLSDMAEGMYFIRVRSGALTQSVKVVRHGSILR
jgi:PKD repeat protein